MRLNLALLILFAGAGLSQTPTSAPASWTPELSLEVKTIGQVVPSPDGQWVAYTQTWAVMEEEQSEKLTHIFLARADGSQRFQLTRGEKSATSPSFSPDASFVYFLSDRSGKKNLWRIPRSGGEAERLTDWKGELGSYQVSPDGKRIAFTGRRSDPDDEKAKKEKRDFRVVDEKPKNHSLWVIPAEADFSEKRPAHRVFESAYHVTRLDWSPDSRKIAFEHTPRPEPDYVFRQADLSEVAVESGEVKLLAATPRREGPPYYSPDGRSLAYPHTSDPPRSGGDCRFVVLPLDSGAEQELAPTDDQCGRGTNLLGWSPDSRGLLFTETRGTQNILKAMSLDGSQTTVYAPSRGTLSSYGRTARLNATGTHVGFTLESSKQPPEAHLLSLAGGDPVRVSEANVRLPVLPLGDTKIVRWKSKDGLEIEGLLTHPVGYEPGEKYPLVVVIHGGPMGVFTQTFIGGGGTYGTRYPIAAFAAKGYAILLPNPRGSSGYGKKFRFANYNDWGGGDYEDIMTGVDHVISMGVADPDRLAVMGWSYGGFMTAWVVTHTKRFKAGAVGAGVTNLWSFTGTADIPGFLPDYFSGEPWEKFEAYRKHSPMTHVKGVTTPTLILHGEADKRVPVSQGYELYNALKRQGVTTKMVVYPREPHGPREPKFVLDIARRHLEWAEKYVK